MSTTASWLVFCVGTMLVPLSTISVIRKTKARLQNRIGPAFLQPFFDIIKLCRKRETLSDSMCGVFRLSTVISFANTLILATMVPWLGVLPWKLDADIYFFVYALGLSRVLSLLGALDAGSAFGAFGASREVTLGFLVEPALVIALTALAIMTGDSNLSQIFALHSNPIAGSAVVWGCSGVAILAASLAELSRMPVDDPTTHLELTMVHEAMILEASARNLALIAATQSLKTALYLGLAAQCFLRTLPAFCLQTPVQQCICSVIALFTLASFVGVLESLIVKLQWRKIPEFVAYILTVSLIASFAAIFVGFKA